MAQVLFAPAKQIVSHFRHNKPLGAHQCIARTQKQGGLTFAAALVLATTLIGMNAQAQRSELSSGTQRAARLLEEAKRDGLVAVAHRTYDPVDLGILELLTHFEHDFSGASEARGIIASRSPAPDRLWGSNAMRSHARLSRPSSTAPAYTVTIRNASTETFSEIVAFYKRINLPGVVFLASYEVQPQAQPVFQMGLCSQLESYVVGFFIQDELVAKIPARGNMTPQLASVFNPSDTYACEDSWSIQ